MPSIKPINATTTGDIMTNFKRNNMINDAIGYTVAATYAALIVSLTVGIVITAIA